nr:FKBP-type peptidyl-prolyl cis-trans isomerase [Amphiplicatus metriothermophilus]
MELLKATNPQRNAEAARKFLEENARRPGVKTTESGLQYEVLAEGPAGGASPTDADIVRVHYEGRLIDGTLFDSSHERGEPAEFPLAQVIPGWTEGVQLMSEGDKFKLYLPPELAYGETGTPNGPIGPNEALVFEVELLEVK